MKTCAANDDCAAGRGQAGWRNGIGVEYPPAIDVVGAAVAALIGNSEADDLGAGGSHLEPGLSGGEAVARRPKSDRSSARRIKAIPDADGRHRLVGVRRARLIERLSHDGEDAVGASRQG